MNNKIELFEQTKIPKAIISMSLPTILSSLVIVLYSLADTYFVGMLNNPIQNAAVTLAAPMLLSFNAITNLCGVGSSSMISRALGNGNYQLVKQSSAFGFYLAFLLSAAVSVLYTIFATPTLTVLGAQPDTILVTASYMFWTISLGAVPAILNVVMSYIIRSEGSTMHASIGTMCGCILNIILDPIFIMPWGKNMGAAGAGCATFLSNCVACLYFFILLYFKRKNSFVSIHPKYICFHKTIIVGIFSVGIPATIQNLLNVTGMTILNVCAAAYGSNAVAAIGIAQRITMIPVQIALGGSQGIMPLIGYNFANKNNIRMKEAIQYTLYIMLPFLLIISIFYHTFSASLIRLFIDNNIIVTYGGKLLRGFCIALPFIGMDFITVGIFQACGMGKRALYFAILRKIILEIPAIIIWNKLIPFYGLSYSQTTAELILSIISIISLRQILKMIDSSKITS